MDGCACICVCICACICVRLCAWICGCVWFYVCICVFQHHCHHTWLLHFLDGFDAVAIDGPVTLKWTSAHVRMKGKACMVVCVSIKSKVCICVCVNIEGIHGMGDTVRVIKGQVAC